MPRLLSLGLIAAFALVAAACGANPAPSDDVADAAEKTKAVGTVRFEMVSGASVVDPEAETFDSRSTGVIDDANDRSEHRDESSGCRTIVIGAVVYAELSADEGSPAGKRWVEYAGEDDFDSEALFEQYEQLNADEEDDISSYRIIFGTPEPAVDDYLDYLREDSEPERVGEEDVRGVPTTHYRGELNMRSRIKASLEAGGWKSANIERYLEGVDETRQIMDVWVDSEGRARRVVTTDETLDAEVGSVTTTEYFDFGVEAKIQAPPAAEVLASEEFERITEKQTETEDEDSAEPSCLH